MKFHVVARSVQQFTCLYDLWARSVSPRARYHFLGKPFYQMKMSLSIMRMKYFTLENSVDCKLYVKL